MARTNFRFRGWGKATFHSSRAQGGCVCVCLSVCVQSPQVFKDSGLSQPRRFSSREFFVTNLRNEPPGNPRNGVGIFKAALAGASSSDLLAGNPDTKILSPNPTTIQFLQPCFGGYRGARRELQLAESLREQMRLSAYTRLSRNLGPYIIIW